jgi:hypothetical protein
VVTSVFTGSRKQKQQCDAKEQDDDRHPKVHICCNSLQWASALGSVSIALRFMARPRRSCHALVCNISCAMSKATVRSTSTASALPCTTRKKPSASRTCSMNLSLGFANTNTQPFACPGPPPTLLFLLASRVLCAESCPMINAVRSHSAFLGQYERRPKTSRLNK